MDEYNIKKVLRQCKKAAANGYKISMKQYKSLNDTMRRSSDKIEITLTDISSSPCYVSEATESLSNQLANTRELLNYLSISLFEDIKDLKEKLSSFSITLFGKTMAGKSTLMETLTEGDGLSIGKGSQRTTRDVRTYTWNNLEITDVPGIGAFEGKEDEQIAFAAARKADLIIFLITDDAPQAAEAKCLGEIIELGKPVICVLNVKSSIRDNESSKMTLRNIEKAFDDERLDNLKKQFFAYASLSGEVWDDIPIISVHLKAAFMAQNTKDSEYSRDLYKASRIDSLKERIIDEVKTHGKYYREKNFLDIISVSTLDVFENLLFQSYINDGLSSVVCDKKNQLYEWIKKYQRDSGSLIESLISKIDNELKMEIPTFVEEHYEDKEVAKEWERFLASQGIESRCKELANNILEEADERLKELARELSNEITYTSNILLDENSNKIPKMHRIIDAKKVWNWGSLIAGGGLSIAGGILFFAGSAAAGPVGWIALGVSVIGIIGSFIFKSKGKKEDQAKKKLEEKLRENASEICDSLRKQLNETLERIVSQRLNIQYDELNRIIELIKYLSKTQKELAVNIQPKLLEQSKQIMDASLKLIFGGRYSNRIVSGARVPGKILVAQLEDGTQIPPKTADKLRKLMQEELVFFESSDDKELIVRRIIDSEIHSINIENDVVIIKLKDDGKDNSNRVRVVQQFLGCYVDDGKEKSYA